MTRTEIARLGGQALAAKVSSSYFAFIGRRGGRKTKRKELLEFAGELAAAEPERAEIWIEKADHYRDEPAGNRVMIELWDIGNCEPRQKRRRANTDQAKLRRWEKAVRGNKSKRTRPA